MEPNGSKGRPFEIDLNEAPPEGSAGVTCGTCGKPRGGGVGGERRGEWECFNCVLTGGGARRMIDVNEPSADVAASRGRMCLGSNIFGRSSTGPIATANFLNLGRDSSLSKTSRRLLQIPRLITQNTNSPILETGIFPPPPTNLDSALQSQSEVYLEALREFINQRRGYLSEGWSVDFFYCQNRCRTSAVYCAPDGSRFVTMDDVARHLGLQERLDDVGRHLGLQEQHILQNENDGFVRLQRRLHTPQVGNQSMRLSRGSSFRENQNIGSPSFQNSFPVQFEDLFILSSGIIDSRPSYHNISQIWPIGYRSCWHDKISGSIFVSEVVEGGDTGPIFRVRRYTCSAFPIPVGSTVLSRKKNPSPCNGKEKEKVTNICSTSNGIDNSDDDYDEFLKIQMMLNEDTPPNLEEIDFDKASSSKTESESVNNAAKELVDCIGEFSVESRSSLLAWEMASRALLHACHVAYKQTGKVRFYCKHDVDGENVNEENIQDQLSKFCSWSGPIDNVKQLINKDAEFEAIGKLLIKWLQQDRFGLDTEFVQEILEQLPNVHACSGYRFLNRREQNSGLRTIESGYLLSKRRNEDFDALERDGISLNWKRARMNLEDSALRKSLPLGKPFSKLPPCLVGDVLQGWEFLWRFSEILGLEEPFSLMELESELIHPWVGTINPAEEVKSEFLNWDITKCTGVALRKAHISLLRAIIAELVLKVVACLDLFSEAAESKSKRAKKKDVERDSSSVKKMMIDMLQINELTWPEIARRYILVILSLEGNIDSAEINSSIGSKIFHCLQGDGGILCGSLTGVAGMEADALLLAEARKQIFKLPKNNEVLIIDKPKPEEISTPKVIELNDDDVPEWAQALEPVRKLPTNVGARLKKCVIQALELNPPDWARQILEHSISREVYKGNASGPTKRAVVSVLSEISSKGISSNGISSKSIPQPRPLRREIVEGVKTFSDLVMKYCRIVLRKAAAVDDKKVFCNLLGKTLYPYDNNDEGFLGSSATVSRPLDFRVIDFRLAAGAYAGSHEAFFEDVCEMWNNIRSIYSERSDLVKLVEKLSQKFKGIYQEEVISLVQKLPEDSNSLSLTDEVKRGMDPQLLQVIETSLPKAPWEEGICKVCGVDRDDDNVLLCDGCDSEYHTYCLNPPLARIPDGNWYCPSCVAGRYKSRGAPRGTQVTRFKKKKIRGEFTQQLMEMLSQLARSMGSKEYWNCNVEERTLLFKFLSDETLNTSLLRDHVDHCGTVSIDLHQKMRFLSTEWKTLKSREDVLGSILKKSTTTAEESAHNGSMQETFAEPKPVEQTLDDSLGNESNNSSEQPLSSFSKSKADKSPVSKKKQKCTGQKPTDKEEEELPDSIDDQTLESVSNNNEDVTMSQANDTDITSLKQEMSAIQESISSIESELEKMSIRKEFLGRDSAGRVYWGFQRGETCLLLVDRSLEDPYQYNFGRFSQISMGYPQGNRVPTPGWISYRSDDEISEIVEWLSCGEVRERNLRDSILQWQKSKFKDGNVSQIENVSLSSKLVMNDNATPSDYLVTKAVAILEKRHGPCQGQKGKLPSEGTMYRCDCLELIWPSKNHCLLCHKSHSTNEELEKHYVGNCSKRVEEESRKGKKVVSEPSTIKRTDEKKIGKMSKEKNKLSSTKSKSQDPECPHDFKEISSKFVTQNSLRELVRGIGLLGSGGNPSFIPNSFPYLDDTTLRLGNTSEYNYGNGSKDSDINRLNFNNFSKSSGNDSGEGTSKIIDFEITRHRSLVGRERGCVIPEMSLRRLVSREGAILRELQMNLLDMIDALPEEAVRVSMSQPENFIAWRAFVKAAGSIYEMVQATIVLENMIRAEYLRREWWYWSSLTAAANTSTLSAFALRLCTLDNAIIYEKPAPNSDSTEISESENKENELTPPKSDKGKEKVSPSKPSDSPKPKSKNKKRRKD